jgi:predicted anti-sigma-YlaC factor YlaD
MHRHEDCRQLLNSLSGYVDGDLHQELCDEIELHMKDCENCRIVVDTLNYLPLPDIIRTNQSAR